MKEQLKIYLEQLKDGHSRSLDEEVDVDFLSVNEVALAFTGTVRVQGEVYLAGNELILHLDIGANCVIPCKICNKPVLHPIKLKGTYFTVSLDQIDGGIYNCQELIREAILLEVPLVVECESGRCQERDRLKKYFKDEKKEGALQVETWHPFKEAFEKPNGKGE